MSEQRSMIVPSAEQIAQQFHEAYERLAPSFGYETRDASRKPWADVPEQNKLLMTAVCAEVLDTLSHELERLKESASTLREERDAARKGLFSHLTGEHALAEPTYAAITEEREGLKKGRHTRYEQVVRECSRTIDHLTTELLRAGAKHRDNGEPCQHDQASGPTCINPLHLSLAALTEPHERLTDALHRCSGCGHCWQGSTGAELCGDCWRKGQDVVLANAEGS